jgi:hypothetical protein
MRVLFCLAVLLWAAPAAAADLCVGDGSAGTDATAKASINYIAGNEAGSTCWDSIGRAAWGSTNRASPGATSEAVAAGDTVYVFGGTYDSADSCNNGVFECRYEVWYRPAYEGTASNNMITFVCVGTCTLTGDTVNAPVIGSYDRDYVKWYADRNAGHSWTIVACGEDPTNGATDECTDGSQWAAIPDTGPIVLGSATGIWVEGVIISSVQTTWTDNWEGIRFNFCTNCTARNNSISDFVNGGFSLNGTCFTVYHSTNFLIEHNECDGSSTGWIVKNNGSGVSSGTLRFNKIFETLLHCFVWSIVSGGAGEFEADIQVYQNTCDSPGQYGVRSQGAPGALNCRIVNNTFYNLAVGIGLGTYDGCWFYNNIIHTAGVMVEGGTASAAAMDHEHNVYYNATTRFYSGSPSNQATLADFNSAFAGMNTVSPTSVDTDPRLANAAGGDFRLCTASMAPDASCAGESSVRATPLGVDVLDLDGDASTSDNIPPGAYILSGQTEDVGITGDAAPAPDPVEEKRLRVLRFVRAIPFPPMTAPTLRKAA